MPFSSRNVAIVLASFLRVESYPPIFLIMSLKIADGLVLEIAINWAGSIEGIPIVCVRPDVLES